MNGRAQERPKYVLWSVSQHTGLTGLVESDYCALSLGVLALMVVVIVILPWEGNRALYQSITGGFVPWLR